MRRGEARRRTRERVCVARLKGEVVGRGEEVGSGEGGVAIGGR